MIHSSIWLLPSARRFPTLTPKCLVDAREPDEPTPYRYNAP
jgi:hypothetical protein